MKFFTLILICLVFLLSGSPAKAVESLTVGLRDALDYDTGPVDSTPVLNRLQTGDYIEFIERKMFGSTIRGWVVAISDTQIHLRTIPLGVPQVLNISSATDQNLTLFRHLRFPFGEPTSTARIPCYQFYDFENERWVYVNIGAKVSGGGYAKSEVVGILSFRSLLTPADPRATSSFDFYLDLGPLPRTIPARALESAYGSGLTISVQAGPGLNLANPLIQAVDADQEPVQMEMAYSREDLARKYQHLEGLRPRDIVQIINNVDGDPSDNSPHVWRTDVAYSAPYLMGLDHGQTRVRTNLALLPASGAVVYYRKLSAQSWGFFSESHPQGVFFNLNETVFIDGAAYEVTRFDGPQKTSTHEPLLNQGVVLSRINAQEDAEETLTLLFSEFHQRNISQVPIGVSESFLANLYLIRANALWTEANRVAEARRAERTPLALVLYNRMYQSFGPASDDRFRSLERLPEELQIPEASPRLSTCRKLVSQAQERLVRENQLLTYWRQARAAAEASTQVYGERFKNHYGQGPLAAMPPAPGDANLTSWNASLALSEAIENYRTERRAATEAQRLNSGVSGSVRRPFLTPCESFMGEGLGGPGIHIWLGNLRSKSVK